MSIVALSIQWSVFSVQFCDIHRNAMNYGGGTRHQADFEVRYRFYDPTEGGRVSGPPRQHVYRCDWAYDGDEEWRGATYMIWPEFLHEDGSIIAEGDLVLPSGAATMWILSDDLRLKVHQDRIKPGVRGFFMEGGRRVAEATVSRVLGLQGNSQQTSRDTEN